VHCKCGPRANGTRIETPKASRGGIWEGVSPSPVGEGFGEGCSAPSPENVLLFPFEITRFDAFCNTFYSSDGGLSINHNSQTAFAHPRNHIASARARGTPAVDVTALPLLPRPPKNLQIKFANHENRISHFFKA